MRLQFYVNIEVSRRITHVGDLLGLARGKAAAFLMAGATQFENFAAEAIRQRLDQAQTAPRRPRRGADLWAVRPSEIVLLQIPLDKRVGRKIERLAQQHELPQAKVCAWLLDRAIADESWILQLVQARLREGLRKEPSRASLARSRSAEMDARLSVRGRASQTAGIC